MADIGVPYSRRGSVGGGGTGEGGVVPGKGREVLGGSEGEVHHAPLGGEGEVMHVGDGEGGGVEVVLRSDVGAGGCRTSIGHGGGNS